jgi:hypothetical protein
LGHWTGQRRVLAADGQYHWLPGEWMKLKFCLHRDTREFLWTATCVLFHDMFVYYRAARMKH